MVLDIADYGLIGVHGEVLVPDGDLLLAASAVVIEPLGKHDHSALRLIGKGKVSAPRLEIFVRLSPGLLKHRHRRLMSHDQLRNEHSFDGNATANGVAGGRQTVYTAGMNWCVNRNVRFMFDYLHGNITKQASPTNFADVGAKFDAFAMRTQVAF